MNKIKLYKDAVNNSIALLYKELFNNGSGELQAKKELEEFLAPFVAVKVVTEKDMKYLLTNYKKDLEKRLNECTDENQKYETRIMLDSLDTILRYIK